METKHDLAVMISTAGVGSRLRPFSDTIPKPLMPIMGRPCLQWVIDWTLEQLSEQYDVRFVLNSSHLHQEFLHGLKKLEWYGYPYQVSDESSLLMGSAGGFRKALPLLGDKTFLRLNGDRIAELDLKGLIKFHNTLNDQSDLTMLMLDSSPLIGKYREIMFDRQTQRVTAFGEEKTNVIFWGGAAIIHPRSLMHLSNDRPSDILDYLKPLIEAKKVFAFESKVSNALFADIDSPRLWKEAHFQLLNRDYGRDLWQDVYCVDEESSTVFYGTDAQFEAAQSKFPDGFCGIGDVVVSGN